VTAFIASVIITLLMLGVVIFVGKRRPRGKPLTWGEAFIAGVFIFGLFLMIYGIFPDSLLRLADGELKWRSDAIGIPTGPIPGIKNHTLFADGITFFGRGRILVSKQVIRDVLVSGIYIIFGLAQIFIWLWWQKRGTGKPATPELETSAYGRPLVRGS
jgi:hypothetical protein